VSSAQYARDFSLLKAGDRWKSVARIRTQDLCIGSECYPLHHSAPQMWDRRWHNSDISGYLRTDFSGFDQASLFHHILILLSFTVISFIPICITFDLHLWISIVVNLFNFLGTINLHFTLLFVFTLSRYHVIFSSMLSLFLYMEQMLMSMFIT